MEAEKNEAGVKKTLVAIFNDGSRKRRKCSFKK